MADASFLAENNGAALIGTASVFLVLSWISFALRSYTRLVLMKGYTADDWFMFAGQVIFTITCGFILQGVHDGIGRHNDAIRDNDKKVNALMWQALATATYVLDMMFIKLSIGVFLLRLAVRKVYTWIIRATLVVIAIWSIAIFFWDIFQCKPVTKQWDFRIEGGQCVSASQIVSAAYAISVMTILSDWLFALIPIPMLWSVKMTKQAKTTVIMILGLGVFASVATLVRLRFLSDLTDTDDILFAGTDAMVWTLIEPGVAIVASSLVTIRPLLRAMHIKGFDSSDSTYATNHSTRTNLGSSRPKVVSVPVFGADDVSLGAIETESDTRPLRSHPINNTYMPEAHFLKNSRGGSRGSEVYTLQGSNPAALSHNATRANGSFRQPDGRPDDIEAQNMPPRWSDDRG